jgi:hypothetical protein
VLGTLFEIKREKATGTCRKLSNEEFHNLYSSPNNIKVLISRRMRWA